LHGEVDFGALIVPAEGAGAVAHVIDWWECPRLAQTKGENGRQAILQTYNWEALIEKLDKLYQSLLGAP
jgi:glycosyltransferase involved in cell wall biosynthesis